jgi:hypothetical protein
VDVVWFCDGSDYFTNVVTEFGLEFWALCDVAFEGDEAYDCLAFDFVWFANGGGFCHCWVGD